MQGHIPLSAEESQRISGLISPDSDETSGRKDLFLKGYLIVVGNASAEALPTIFSSFAGGIVPPVSHMDVFHLAWKDSDPALAEMAALYNRLSDAVSPGADSFPLFRQSFAFEACRVDLPSFTVSDSPDSSDAQLLSALRGAGQPISFQTDPDAVEWAFRTWLETRDSDCPLFRFLSRMDADEAEASASARMIILFDPVDSFSAGVSRALVSFLRQRDQVHSAHSVALLALLRSISPLPDSFYPTLRTSLKSLFDSVMAPEDALTMLSIPPSFLASEQNDAFPLASCFTAVAISHLWTAPEFPSGIHTMETDDISSLRALGGNAHEAASAILMTCWMLCDILPALHALSGRTQHHLSIPSASRSSFFRRFFPQGQISDGDRSLLDRIESALFLLLRELARVLNAFPPSMLPSDEMAQRFQRASDACGRFITVFSEYEVSRAEAHESGLDQIQPVHRDSLADTEEERLLHRLDQMQAQMLSELKLRDEALSDAGSLRARQALLLCFSRCNQALAAAESRLSGMSAQDEPLAFSRMKRRIRLLTAAANRCHEDLKTSADRFFSKSKPASTKGSAENGILSVPVFDAICRFLKEHPDNMLLSETASSTRLLRDALPSLLQGVQLPDAKALRKKLLRDFSSSSSSDTPLLALLSSVALVCREEAERLTFSTEDRLPPIPLLPDLLPESTVSTPEELLMLLPDGNGDHEEDTDDLRGLLAMLVLSQYRRLTSDEPRLRSFSVTPAHPFSRAFLSTVHASFCTVFSLSNANGTVYAPFAVLIPDRPPVPARRLRSHASLIPSFVTWWEADRLRFMDPIPFLSESDRTLLLSALSAVAATLARNSALSAFLDSFLTDLNREEPAGEPDASFSVRLQAVCGLMDLPAYRGLIERIPCIYEPSLARDSVASALTGRDDFPAVSCTALPQHAIYTFRSIPFAREHSGRMLESSHDDGESVAISLLKSDSDFLFATSDQFRDALVRNLSGFSASFPSAFQSRLDALNRLLSDSRAPLSDRIPELTWPWDSASPSVRSLLEECLGPVLCDGALSPFSDCITVFPARSGEVLGDSLLSSLCTVDPVGAVRAPDESAASRVNSDAVLPPLSPAFADCLVSLPEGRILLSDDFLSFSRADEASLQVALTLHGTFTLRLIRTYSAAETVSLYSRDIPTLALWPSVPFPEDQWHAYFIYAHLPDSFSLSLPDETRFSKVSCRHTARLSSFPLRITLVRENASMGTLLNILPAPDITPSGPFCACIDFGSVATSVILSSGTSRSPMHGPVMIRTLLNNPAASRDLLRQEFLPAVPVSALLPTVSRLFRNVPGSDPEPFQDGIVLMAENLQDMLSIPSSSVYTCLKWEDIKGRSPFICLHQVMLISALQARWSGASTLSFRFAIPDEMAPEGRESLLMLFRSLTDRVLSDSGFPIDPSGLPVSFASESTAIGAYFRFVAPEDTRGGFMVLDIGACSADLSLFLRGRDAAVRTCQLPLGIHYMLLPTLLRHPDLFSEFRDDSLPADFLRSLTDLSEAFSSARMDPSALRTARIALDLFLADHMPLLITLTLRLHEAGYASRACAILLLHLAYLMMLSGLSLLQIAADPKRNDFLPQQMSLCLAGRGSVLMESLPAPVQSSLWRFLTMFRNRRVASISLLFSSEKKMEIPVGLSVLSSLSSDLPSASSPPASLAVRPEELLPEFLLLFRREFPASAALLFPGFFTDDYYHPFTASGESALSATISMSFPPQETPRPFSCLAAWIGNLLEYLTF